MSDYDYSKSTYESLLSVWHSTMRKGDTPCVKCGFDRWTLNARNCRDGYCYICDYWQTCVNQYNAGGSIYNGKYFFAARIADSLYTWTDGIDTHPAHRGHGGQPFTIQTNDGVIHNTNNLWLTAFSYPPICALHPPQWVLDDTTENAVIIDGEASPLGSAEIVRWHV